MSKDAPELSSSMSKEELEKRKLLIENRKILVELKQLQLPWWKKPAYIGVLFPTLLAFGTLSIAFITGYFQNEYKLIDIKREHATEKEQALNKSIADLTDRKDQLELDYISKKKELEFEYASKKQELDDKIKKADQEIARIDKDSIKLILEAQAKRQELADRFRELDSEFQKKSEAIALELKQRLGELETTKRALVKSEVKHALAPDPLRPVPTHIIIDYKIIENLRALIEKNRDDSQLYVNALHEMAGEDDRILPILYKVTGESKWKNEFFQLVLKETKDGVFQGKPNIVLLGRILSDRIWDRNDTLEIIDLLFQLMEMHTTDNMEKEYSVIFTLHSLLADLNVTHHQAFTISQIKHIQGYLNTIRRLRDILLNPPDASNPLLLFRQNPPDFYFELLGRLSHECYIVVLATTIVSPKNSNSKEWVDYLYKNQKEKLDEPLRNYSDHPDSSDAASWGKWLENNNRIVKLWLEDDLKTLRAKPELLRQ